MVISSVTKDIRSAEIVSSRVGSVLDIRNDGSSLKKIPNSFHFTERRNTHSKMRTSTMMLDRAEMETNRKIWFLVTIVNLTHITKVWTYAGLLCRIKIETQQFSLISSTTANIKLCFR